MNRFFISDTHFGHDNINHFLDNCGNKLRPFANAQEMDDALVENWNKVVGIHDKVYHLGDVAIPKSGLQVLKRLNGNKVLIRGNHDVYKLKDYAEHFKDIRGAFVMDQIIFTHIPIHKECSSRFIANVHGHLHANNLNDPFYINVSVEQIGFTPISYEELKLKINKICQ